MMGLTINLISVIYHLCETVGLLKFTQTHPLITHLNPFIYYMDQMTTNPINMVTK